MGQVSGPGPGTFTQAFVANTLNQRLRYALVHDDLVRRNALPSAAGPDARPRRQLPQQFSDQAGKLLLRQLPASYQATLVQRQADVQALASRCSAPTPPTSSTTTPT